jgi:hypothetical protein
LETTLILIGVGCLIGAVIGGGVKLVQVELRPVDSVKRQILLAGLGIALIVAGLIAGGHFPGLGGGSTTEGGNETVPAGNSGETIASPEQAKETPPPADADADAKKQTATSSPGPDKPVAVSRIDIFWCVGEDAGAAREGVANRVSVGLRSGLANSPTVRIRPLSAQTNAQPDYDIHADIVRYDPGELDAAQIVSTLATGSSGRSFNPEHALPGTPSVDYLSVFVCAGA